MEWILYIVRVFQIWPALVGYVELPVGGGVEPIRKRQRILNQYRILLVNLQKNASYERYL